MKNGLTYSVLMVSILSLLSCTSTKKQGSEVREKNVPIEVKNVDDTLVYHIERYKDFSPYFSKTEDGFDSTIYTASYPVFSSAIDTLVKPAIFIDGESKAEQVAESFLGGFNDYAEESIEAGNNFLNKWFMDQQCNVMLNVPRFVTLRNKISSYSGGAHGMEVNLWFNYDLRDNRLLTITDIIKDTTKLTEIVEHHFREHEKLNQDEGYGESYFFDQGQFVLADNFGLTRDGLVFHYNPYEIKPYALGSTTIIIPYEEIKGILTSRGTVVLKNIAQK